MIYTIITLIYLCFIKAYSPTAITTRITAIAIMRVLNSPFCSVVIGVVVVDCSLVVVVPAGVVVFWGVVIVVVVGVYVVVVVGLVVVVVVSSIVVIVVVEGVSTSSITGSSLGDAPLG